MFSLRNRILVLASTGDADSSIAFQNYGTGTADKMALEAFQKLIRSMQYHYASIALFASSIDFSTLMERSLFSKLYDTVSPGGTVSFHLALPKEESEQILAGFKKQALYAGFIDAQLVRDKENAQLRRTVQLVVQRPTWSQGAAATVGPDAMIDESTLLDDSVYVPLGKGKSDCASKPRACANCTCGRKELEAEVGAEEAKRRLENATVRSSCGNCYLGDAFRCSGCPYKGQPAFKPGSKVQLDLFQNESGALMTELAESEKVTEGAAVKIQI